MGAGDTRRRAQQAGDRRGVTLGEGEWMVAQIVIPPLAKLFTNSITSSAVKESRPLVCSAEPGEEGRKRGQQPKRLCMADSAEVKLWGTTRV